jgi:hypothetical protein
MTLSKLLSGYKKYIDVPFPPIDFRKQLPQSFQKTSSRKKLAIIEKIIHLVISKTLAINFLI